MGLSKLAKQETFLVLRAQAGDREALDELLQCVQEPLYRYVVSLVGSRTLAEDILQEVFILIYRQLGWLREPKVFRPWAYRIATREAFKQLKRERRWTDASVDETALEEMPTPVNNSITPEQISQLVEQVSPASRAVIALHYLHDMQLDEVADVLGVALGTVKSRLAYGLGSLRKLMANQ